MSLKVRLDRLEARLGEDSAPIAEAEEREKQHWLVRARNRRTEAMPPDVRHARDLIGLFRTQEILSEMAAGELVDRIVRWRPEPEGGRSRSTVEREVALAVYEREPGTEGMVCSSEWRESFVAGSELRERHSLIPDEVLIDPDESRWEPESFGITQGLLNRAVGSDAGEIAEEEAIWRMREYLHDAFYGERGYRMARLADLEAERGGR